MEAEMKNIEDSLSTGNRKHSPTITSILKVGYLEKNNKVDKCLARLTGEREIISIILKKKETTT